VELVHVWQLEGHLLHILLVALSTYPALHMQIPLFIAAFTSIHFVHNGH
jgi:hypothetical protein